MRPIAEITDDCIKLMKPHELWPWEDWGTKILQNGEVPSHKTFKFTKWVEIRNREKQKVNTEFSRRKRPERLVCVGHGQGIILVNEKDVAEITADRRIRKIVGCFIKGHKEMSLLAGCTAINETDRKMLERLSGLIELQQNTMLGTMSRMQLPEPAKKRILKHLGVETKKSLKGN